MDSIPERLAVAGSPCTLFHRTTSYPLLKIIVNDKGNRQNACMKTIQLQRGLVAIVDDEDFKMVSEFKWWAGGHKKRLYSHGYYRKSYNSRLTQYMHRLVMKAPRGMDVDHINHNTLDNRKSNLRLATRSQTNQNRIGTKRYKGVYFDRDRKGKRWRANIKIFKRVKYLGRYATAAEAATAYNKAAIKEFGEFAYLNKVD